MPVPGRRLKPEMPRLRELVIGRAPQANRQKQRADNHMEAMETRRDEKGRGKNAAMIERKWRVRVFPGLAAEKHEAEHHGDGEAADQPLLVALQQAVMRPGDRRAGQQQVHGVEQGNGKRIDGGHAHRRPDRGRRNS